MLKSANEIAKVSQAAKRKVTEQELQKRQSALLMQAERQKFEKIAVDAATAGKGFIVVSQIHFGESQLKQLGFLVERLEKKPERLNFLEKTCGEVRVALQDCIGRLHNETPLVQVILQDASLQSSSFIPFLEWLWRDGLLKDAASVDALQERLKTYDGVDVNWVERKRTEFAHCLELFFRLKLGDSKLEQLRTGTQLIPEGAHSAYLVSWDDSKDCGGNVVEFSAQKLKWMSVHWANMSAILNAKLVEAAEKGAIEFSFVMEFDGRVWFLDDGSTSESPGAPYGVEACSPNLIEAHLSEVGYRVLVQSLSFDENYVEEVLTPLDLRKSPPTEGDLCRLTIQWS